MSDNPTQWAICIGVNGYHPSLGPLNYAVQDCMLMEETLVSEPLHFPQDHVVVLHDQMDAEHIPTFGNIYASLGAFLPLPKEHDLVLVYFAGHGKLIDGKTLLFPKDATKDTADVLGILLENVQSLIQRCKATRKLLIVDACHSGPGRDLVSMKPGMKQQLSQGTGFFTISACDADEVSYEWKDKRQGVFTYFLCQALSGACGPASNGAFTFDRLYSWVNEKVRIWALNHSMVQNPQRFGYGAGDLVLYNTPVDYAAHNKELQEQIDLLSAQLNELKLQDKQRKLEEAKREVSKTTTKTSLDQHVLVKLKLLILPGTVDGTLFVDDELAGGRELQLEPATHSIRFVPVSMEWGVMETIISLDADAETHKHVLRLKRASSARALSTVLATVAFGGALSALAMLLPNETVLEIPEKFYLKFYLIYTFPILPLLGIPVNIFILALGWLISLIRGIEMESGFFNIVRIYLDSQNYLDYDKQWSHDRLLWKLNMILFNLAFFSLFFAPIRTMIVITLMLASLLSGAVFAFIPWEPDSYRRRRYV